MIDLTALARVRLHGGPRVHEVAPVGSRTTACDQHVHLWAAGKPYDTPLAPETAVTCPTCQRTTRS